MKNAFLSKMNQASHIQKLALDVNSYTGLVMLTFILGMVLSFPSPASDTRIDVSKLNSEPCKNCSLRKYEHVRSFYSEIAPYSIQMGLKYNVPPAVVMAVAGWESGYGEGYVAQISGNILSLGARKGEPELPALTMPKDLKTGNYIIDIKKAKSLPAERVKWQKRPPSLKKDYRPAPYAGTDKNLNYLPTHKGDRIKARQQAIFDFTSSFMSTKSKTPVFHNNAVRVDADVAAKGKEILLKCDYARQYIREIGGKPHSFNVRKEWVGHVEGVLKRAGLCQLQVDMVKGVSFEKAWKIK